MKRRRISLALAGMAVSCAVGAALWPHVREAGQLLAAQDDPAALADAQLNSALRNNQKIVAENIGEALAKGDADLANSFVELARAKGVPVADELARKVADAVGEENSTSHFAKRFATGLVTGSADDVASLSGTVTGDLFVIGDVRDVVRESKHLAMGEETDRLVLGLATAGIAVTAATYFSVGGALPVRAGLSLVKDARKVGRLGEGLAVWAGRSAREVVDTPALERAVAKSSVFRPGQSVNAISAAFRAEKAGGLVRLAKDVGRVTEKVGTRGALDTLKISEGPKDVARAARLAEAKGGQTRAILKILGRGALLLAGGMFDLALWLFWALFAVFGVLCSIKSTTERATQAWLDRKKARLHRRRMAAAADAAMSAAQAPAAIATAAA
jgi:ATP-dependent protease HslVU (ClpYQ) peptidase subunit